MPYQGLIQNEAPNVIELVKGLVEDKIGGENSENTLILITIPMSGGSLWSRSALPALACKYR
jgi:hypothetical protein